MSAISRRIVARGRVQGVGYRYAMVSAAEHARVHGWVRNRRDGAVEAFLQGEGSAVLAMVAWCERGPAGAEVTDVEVYDAEVDPTFATFEARPTA